MLGTFVIFILNPCLFYSLFSCSAITSQWMAVHTKVLWRRRDRHVDVIDRRLCRYLEDRMGVAPDKMVGLRLPVLRVMNGGRKHVRKKFLLQNVDLCL